MYQYATNRVLLGSRVAGVCRQILHGKERTIVNRQKWGRLRAVFAVAMMLALGLAMPWRMAFGDETSQPITQKQDGGVIC